MKDNKDILLTKEIDDLITANEEELERLKNGLEIFEKINDNIHSTTGKELSTVLLKLDEYKNICEEFNNFKNLKDLFEIIKNIYSSQDISEQLNLMTNIVYF